MIASKLILLITGDVVAAIKVRNTARGPSGDGSFTWSVITRYSDGVCAEWM